MLTSESVQNAWLVTIAGHICLDVIPYLGGENTGYAEMLVPGKLVEIGPAQFSTGGVVANTGIALHRLGWPVCLQGMVGDDAFGGQILQHLQGQGAELADHMIVAEGLSSSYTLVLSRPGLDRIFLHHPGVNDAFQAKDLKMEAISANTIFHFGYPPLMRNMYTGSGEELVCVYKKAKDAGAITSMDLALPDPDSDAGKADWRSILSNTLPYVDIFLPSLDEIHSMTGDGSKQAKDFSAEQLSELGDRLIDMGCALVVIKLGDQGLYFRSTRDSARLSVLHERMQEINAEWLGRELYQPCHQADVVGTTGAGDSTIAGFLAGVSAGLDPLACLEMAVGTGGTSVEAADASSGIPSWQKLIERMNAGWQHKERAEIFKNWRPCGKFGAFRSKRDEGVNS